MQVPDVGDPDSHQGSVHGASEAQVDQLLASRETLAEVGCDLSFLPLKLNPVLAAAKVVEKRVVSRFLGDECVQEVTLLSSQTRTIRGEQIKRLANMWLGSVHV